MPLQIYGIKCEYCSYGSYFVEFKDYPQWIGKHCPKCSHTLLTQDDYEELKKMIEDENRWERFVKRFFPWFKQKKTKDFTIKNKFYARKRPLSGIKSKGHR